MAYTQTDVDNLRSAIATGIKIVREGDTEITYNSLKEMRTQLNIMEAELRSARPSGVRLMRIKKGRYS